MTEEFEVRDLSDDYDYPAFDLLWHCEVGPDHYSDQMWNTWEEAEMMVRMFKARPALINQHAWIGVEEKKDQA